MRQNPSQHLLVIDMSDHDIAYVSAYGPRSQGPIILDQPLSLNREIIGRGSRSSRGSIRRSFYEKTWFARLFAYGMHARAVLIAPASNSEGDIRLADKVMRALVNRGTQCGYIVPRAWRDHVAELSLIAGDAFILEAPDSATQQDLVESAKRLCQAIAQPTMVWLRSEDLMSMMADNETVRIATTEASGSNRAETAAFRTAFSLRHHMDPELRPKSLTLFLQAEQIKQSEASEVLSIFADFAMMRPGNIFMRLFEHPHGVKPDCLSLVALAAFTP